MNKKLFALIVLFVGICISSAAGISISNRTVQFCPGSEGKVGISVRFNSYVEVINPYYCENEDTYYYFLPTALGGGGKCITTAMTNYT